MYAELGPSLFEQQLAHTTSAIDLDDSHVEYAKINHSECRLTQPRLLQNPEGIQGYYYQCHALYYYAERDQPVLYTYTL